MSLRYAADLCVEHHYSTLAELQPLAAENSISFIAQGFNDCIISAFFGLVQSEIPPSGVSTQRTQPTCASQYCQPENVNQETQDLPISGTNFGKPKTWRARIGEAAVQNQAEESWDGKDRKKRLRRLGRVVVDLLVIALVMWVF